ncbi:YicC family protein [bacterium]|nr:YicC family protein [bacterium]
MTGYGTGHAKSRAGVFDVEIRSVNGRYRDVRCVLPRELFSLESHVQEVVRRRIHRGQVTVSVSFLPGEGADVAVVDEALATTVVRQLRRIAQKLDIPPAATIETLVRIPDVVRVVMKPVEAEKVIEALTVSLEAAVKQLVAARQREGAALVRDMRKRLALVRDASRKARDLAPSVVENYHARVKRRIAELTKQTGQEPDMVRVMTEVGIFTDRVDISEELTRLDSHIAEFTTTLKGGGEVGRRLDFILQEMFREANTLGVKAASAAVSSHVIRIKEELEKMREQAQNLE